MLKTTQCLPLATGEIHLWVAPYEEIDDDNLHAAYRELLSPEELAQEPRFYFSKDRRCYLVTRALVRTVLSKYVNLSPREWAFSRSAYGRPEIENTSVQGERLSFNLSHTSSMIVLAVSRQRALGIDIENYHRRKGTMDLARRYFAAQEAGALSQAPGHQLQCRFFEYWTLKEAYVKARGLGLSIALDKFSFSYPAAGKIEMFAEPDLGDDCRRWQFWQFKLDPGYLIALCAERRASGNECLTIRRAIPLVSETDVRLEAVRSSS